MTGEESSQREGYGARAAVRCTQTPRRSPAGSGESVCWEVSPCLSCFCSPSSSDWVLPTAGPGELNLERLEEWIGFQVLFTRISKLLAELWLYTCSYAGAALQTTHTQPLSSRVKSGAPWEGVLVWSLWLHDLVTRLKVVIYSLLGDLQEEHPFDPKWF